MEGGLGSESNVQAAVGVLCDIDSLVFEFLSEGPRPGYPSYSSGFCRLGFAVEETQALQIDRFFFFARCSGRN